MLRSLVQAATVATRRALAWNLNNSGLPREQTLFNFANQIDLNKWVVYSDSEHGGVSNAEFELSGNGTPTAVFYGNLSTELADRGVGKIVRGGFSSIHTRQIRTRFDLASFDTIALRLKGDGRCYVSTLRTECWAGGIDDTNSWQAFVFAPKDEWFEVMIPFGRYVPTWKGKIIETKSEMNLSRVCGLALAVSASGGPEAAVVGPGQFRLELDWIKALRCSDD